MSAKASNPVAGTPIPILALVGAIVNGDGLVIGGEGTRTGGEALSAGFIFSCCWYCWCEVLPPFRVSTALLTPAANNNGGTNVVCTGVNPPAAAPPQNPLVPTLGLVGKSFCVLGVINFGLCALPADVTMAVEL